MIFAREKTIRRRGAALVMVLMTITFTLGLAYAMLRSQATQLVVGENSNRSVDARQAAMAGMSLALRNMNESTWAGVGTTLAGSVSSSEKYSVTFTAGDPSLSESDADYDDYPWRVTLLSTGSATDPANPTVVATHQIQAVVELVPRKLADAPSGWDTVQQHVLYQWGDSDVDIELPCHINGPAYLAGALKLATSGPFDAKPFDGTIDEVAIYEDEYDANAVRDVYQASQGSGSYASITDAYMDKSPIAWWRLNEAAGSTVAVDAIGSHHGEYVEADPGVTGTDSTTAASFDGTDDYIDVGQIDITSGDKMTIFAWVKADTFGTDDTRIISKALTQADSDHYWYLGTTNVLGETRLTGRVRTSFGLLTATAWSGNLVPGQWYFVALVFEQSSGLRLYVDGSSVAWAASAGMILQNPYASVFIGDDPPGGSRGQYLRDLNAMQEGGSDDERPFTGPVSLPYSSADRDSLNFLQENLGASTTNIAPTHSAPSTHPGKVTTYQLYTGGPQYTVEALSTYNSAASKSADPKTNPLGVFRVAGNAYFTGNFALEGTVIVEADNGADGDAFLSGSGNVFKPVELPPLHGTTDPIQLPVIIGEDDVVIQAESTMTIGGMVWAADLFQRETDSDSGLTEIAGSVVASEFIAGGHARFAFLGSAIWQDLLAMFRAQFFTPLDYNLNLIGTWSVFVYVADPDFSYFPEMLKSMLGSMAASFSPNLTIEANSSPVSYHWHDWSKPVFVPHPDDGGLRWELIDWTDSP